MTRHFTFLVNPASGGGAAPQAVIPVARLLREAGARVEVTYSPGPHAVRELLEAAQSRGDVVVSVGGDGMLSSLVDRVRLPKKLQYPYAAVRSLASYQPGRYRVSVDGVDQEYAAATVVIANSAYYGKGMKIAPAAVIDDGVLDVVVIEAASRLELLRSLPTVYDGTHVNRPEVTVLRGKRVELRGDARNPIPLGGDGEALGVLPGLDSEPAVVEIQPGALCVIAGSP